jgi:glycosyltransferase involved in cell wall biosynthesis
MKLLMITPYLGETYGGTSKVVTELASSLGALNLSVDVVTTTANDTDILEISTDDWLAARNYRVRYFPSWHRSDLIFSSAMLRWLHCHIKDYDIVHTHTLFAPLITLTHGLCFLHRIPYVVTPHGMLQPWALANRAWKKKIYYAALEKTALTSASAIQILTDSEEKQVQALGNSQTTLVSNGIHPADFANLPSPDLFFQTFPQTRGKALVLFLGRIDPKKGLDLLAPAFAQAKSRFPNAHLVVAGPDSTGYLSTVHRYFAQAGCLDAVTFTGMLSGELKQTALSAASVYVAPSYSEGFSMSVLEGMAAGLACVITTGCNFPGAALANAAHVVEISAESIGRALCQCLENKIAAEALGRRARDFVFNNYSWERSATKLLQVYLSILEETDLSDAEVIAQTAT